MAFREIPEIRYNTEIGRLVKYYKRSYSLVVAELIRQLENNGADRYVAQEASLARQLQIIIQQNDEQVFPEIETMITDAHTKGQAQALLALGTATTLAEATRNVSMSMLRQKSVEKMVTDTFEDLLALTARTDKRIKKQVRDTVGEVMRMNAIQQLGYDTSKKQIMERLLQQKFSKEVTANFKGVTDSAGRNWKLDKYVGMVVRTKIQQAYTEGVITESIERGTDLGVISAHGAFDACRHYEGMVISLTGATSGYYTYQELRATNKIFHPNCKHTVTPLREFDLLPDALKEQHRNKMAKL